MNLALQESTIYLTAPNGRPRARPSVQTSARIKFDGKELFFRSSDAVMAVDIGVSAAGDLQAGVPRKLFEAPNMQGTQWDVTRDGRRFLINVAPATNATTPPIRVVLNWNRPAAP